MYRKDESKKLSFVVYVCFRCCVFLFAGRILCHLELCGGDEVNQAVKAAKSAFGYWSKMSGMERARIMINAAHIMEV